MSKEDTLLLSFYRIVSFLLGLLLLFTGMFFAFTSSTVLVLIPALALILTGIILKPKCNAAMRKFGSLSSMLGIVSYAYLLFQAITPEKNTYEISFTDIAVFITLILSVKLYKKIPTS